MPYNIIITILLVFISFGCENEPIETDPEVVLTDNIKVYTSEKIHNNLSLLVNNGGSTSILVDKKGNTVHEWNFETKLGNDFELLEDGRSIGMFKRSDPVFSFGGFGGVVKIFDTTGKEEWSYDYTNGNDIGHHDVELLPNGNVLFLVWEEIDVVEAQAAGVNFDSNIYIEKLVEVNPTTNQIEWVWRSWDHIVQDYDTNALNFGSIANQPQRININYNLKPDGDFMHANGIDYDATKNLIYISVNFFSEVWVIDHSTTTNEASSTLGGNYNKGGDLLYRFGNPSAYNNASGTRTFYNNHFPNLLENGVPGEGNMLIFGNYGPNQSAESTVYEMMFPDPFLLLPNTNNEPTIVWSFIDDELHNGKISGADRLANGNTLICEGDFGMWEVTPEKEIVWKYENIGSSWRAYGYDIESSALQFLPL
ncbi:MAG: aryl-sulfate sulfotransferase [Flavobacteriaceae bacterium]|jgi:hypothetical protein|nr:aryl-sulfate sulfotransferase [Flavobacteriaceae bacterium]MDG1043191.1 aryl-sulfate sulfotransferase [Flavobacteriaceae bacterium]MDG1384754.1 aryl-sulfate sulfotransferase [Flavobacteriaceae bacterium]